MNREFTSVAVSDGQLIEAHRVTAETAGQVISVGHIARDVSPGDVLVRTNHPDVYEVHSGAAFDEMVPDSGMATEYELA